MTKFRPALLLLFLALVLFALAGAASAAGPQQQQDPYPPSGQPELAPPTPTPDPYRPSAGNDGDAPLPIGVPDGAQSPQQTTTAAQPQPPADDRGLLFLWVGFLAAFLVFLTSIVGSIILFTRRNES